MKKELEEIYNKYCNVEYGWFDKKKTPHFHIYEGFMGDFRMQTPDELRKSMVGVCWETVEAMRDELTKRKIPNNTYFFCIKGGAYYCHSIIVAHDKENNKHYWIEATFKDLKGIHESNDINEFFETVKNNFGKIINKPDYKYNKKDIEIFNYPKPKDHINCVRFYFHCFLHKI